MEEEALHKFECQIIRDDGAQKILNCDLSCTLFTQWAILNLIGGFFSDFSNCWVDNYDADCRIIVK